MREETEGLGAQEHQKAVQYPLGGNRTSSTGCALENPPTEEEMFRIQPLTPLSFDTVLTAGDIERILKFVSVV